VNADEVIELFQFVYSFQLLHGHEVYSSPDRNGHQERIWGREGGKAWPVHKADNLTTIYEPVV
jgi:hypothetical protein